MQTRSAVFVSRLSSPLGPLLAAATENGLCMLSFHEGDFPVTEWKHLQIFQKARLLAGENDHLVQVKDELAEYFSGTRQQFDVKLDLIGSDFQKKVWNCLIDIPYGKTITYMEEALLLGIPEAIRAVAASNGLNKIAIVVPCHRVMGTNGKLTGYAGGLERKRWLINHESDHCTDPSKPLRLF